MAVHILCTTRGFLPRDIPHRNQRIPNGSQMAYATQAHWCPTRQHIDNTGSLKFGLHIRQSPRRMARKIRMGFIGVGSMGFSHLQLFHKECRRQAEAVALCASDPGRITRAMEVAPNMHLFKREEDLIHSDLDAVVVSSPNFTHVPLALETLKAGKHLFLEKPVGITATECRKLFRATEKSDRVLMIGHEL
ncbi:uncharacterized protein METZ01_LOCUS512381, partial [marine metagenome]